jgi:hypothetical protein
LHQIDLNVPAREKHTTSLLSARKSHCSLRIAVIPTGISPEKPLRGGGVGTVLEMVLWERSSAARHTGKESRGKSRSWRELAERMRERSMGRRRRQSVVREGGCAVAPGSGWLRLRAHTWKKHVFPEGSDQYKISDNMMFIDQKFNQFLYD